MKENNENKAKALEENKKNYSSENSTPQNGEDIISNEDAEKLEGGIKHEDLERPSDYILHIYELHHATRYSNADYLSVQNRT